MRVLLTASSAAVGGALAWWHWRGPWCAAFAIITSALLLLAAGVPRAYAPVFAVLEWLIQVLLRSLTWLLLGLVFLLVFVPGRLGLALRRHDPLARWPDRTRSSGWHDVARTSPTDGAARFRTQF